MADIDTVLERLVTDAGFRQRLAEDPAAALSSYDLSAEDLQLLASSLDSGDDAQRGVEQRTSKSAVIGLLASLTGGGSGSGRGGRGGMTNSGDDVPGSSTKPLTATGTYSDGRMIDPVGVADPSPASKYTAPINVASGSGTLRADGSGLPALDGASKDTGFLNQDAPPDDEALHKLPGKPKPGEITLTRSVTADYDGDGPSDRVISADAPPDNEALRMPGRPKPGEITLTRSVAADYDGDGVSDGEISGHATWTSSAPTSEIAPPGSEEAAAADFHNIKLTNARQQVGDELAPPGSGEAEAADFHNIKLTNDPGKGVGRASAPPGGDDFLSIEDE